YAHLLVDQTKVGPSELRGRIAQLALMAAYRASWPVMRRLVPLLAELVQVGGTDELRQIVVYMAATISVDTTLGNRSAGTDSRMRYGDTYREVENSFSSTARS
ncbi:MAG: hypothetical protein OXJ62_06130, partial [Spirochaetaceae bacterium]|nr:hypothetical protein [Spirochaetaceae bacterium]